LSNGDVLEGTLVVSNADPKRTFLTLLEDDVLDPSFRAEIANIKMQGPCAKVNFVLSEEPCVAGMPASHSPAERALFTLVPTLQGAEDSYNEAAKGLLPDTLWVDCVLASNVDKTLAPEGRHMLTCFVQYVPFELNGSDWDQQAGILGDRVTAIIDSYAPGMARSVIARDVVTPLELERRFGITEGNIFHGDISLEQLFTSRPSSQCARYRTPVNGLYLCGAGTHPGGGVTAAPGFNAARQILSDGAAG
jgi:phytoene dehydrogenase-like protein